MATAATTKSASKSPRTALQAGKWALELARKTRSIIAQNIGFSLVLALVGLALAATGYINIWLAPVLYIGGYVVVIANSLRLVRFGEEFSQAEQSRVRREAATPVKPTRAFVSAS